MTERRSRPCRANVYRLLVVCLYCSHAFRACSAETEDQFVSNTPYDKCESIPQQEKVRLKLIVGEWSVIEILDHKLPIFGRQTMDVDCPTVSIKYSAEFATELKFYWTESEGEVDYKFRVNESASPGKWESAGAQTGSLAQTDKYTQFAGLVFVGKAVNDHMVLTFCSPNKKLYSVLLARDKTALKPEEIVSIKKQMINTNLTITQTRRACRNSSSVARATALWLFVALLLTRTLAAE